MIIKALKSSIANPNGKPLPVDKSLGIGTDIHFHEIEEKYKTEEGE